MAGWVSTYRVALDPDTTNELGQNVQGHLDTRYSLDDTHENHKDKYQSHNIRDDTRGSKSKPRNNTSESKARSNNEVSKVLLFGN